MGKVIQRVRKGIVVGLPITVAVVSVGNSVYVNNKNEELSEKYVELYEEKTILENNSILLQESIKEYKVNIDVLKDEVKEKNRKIESLEGKVEDLKKKAKQERISRSESPTTSGSIIGTFEATAYTATCKGCSGTTASGYDVRNTTTYNGYRIVAMDTSVVPMYSVVNISYGDTSFDAIVLDRGGAIKGRKMDLLVGSYNEAMQFGRRDVTVKLIKSGKSQH